MDKFTDETYGNWIKYCENINTKITTMWNFILYNQFNNEEIKRLYRKIRFLKSDNKYFIKQNIDLEKKINKLENQVKDILNEKKYYKNRLNKKRKRENNSNLNIKDLDSEWYENQIKKRPKKYKYMNASLRKKNLSNIFSNIKNIKDIINLQNDKHKFDYIKNKKYKNLFNLIPSLERIDKIIGMNNVKNDIFNMICYFVHNLNNKNDLNHIVITGMPGVGKTTLAQYLGHLYRRIGYLKNNKFIKAKRSDLIGEYCGHTAIKTQKIIDSSEGGVLFIDEIYSLGNPKKKDVFTKECIDTINLNLTEKGDKLLVIIAGYKEDVNKCFFNYNLGLERRFPIRFHIDKYTYQELFLILKKFISDDNWIIEDKITDLIIKNNYDNFKFMGGDMMTIFKYAKENFGLRLMKTSLGINNCYKKLTLEDFNNSIQKFKNINKINNNTLPDFIKHLYT